MHNKTPGLLSDNLQSISEKVTQSLNVDVLVGHSAITQLMVPTCLDCRRLFEDANVSSEEDVKGGCSV